MRAKQARTRRTGRIVLIRDGRLAGRRGGDASSRGEPADAQSGAPCSPELRTQQAEAELADRPRLG